MNRPRTSLATDLPPELLAIVALLGTAGLFTGVPNLRHLPDAFKLVTDGGLWRSIGPLVLVLLVELILAAAACFALAWRLSQVDPVARVMAIIVSGSLAFGLFVGDGLDGTATTVTLVCSLAVVVGLVVPARVRGLFTERPAQGRPPTSMVAAESVVVGLAATALAVGVACLPVTPLRTKYAVVGLALIGISVACLKHRRRLQTTDPAARGLISALMTGYVVAIVVANDGSLAGPLFILLGVAVGVVVLLWLPQDSQAFYGGGAAFGRLIAARPDRPPPPRPQPPLPPPPSSPPVSRTSAPASAAASVASASASVAPLPAPAPPPPRPPRPEPSRPSPYAPPPPSPAPAVPSPRPAPVRTPESTTPPRWLSEPPPPGFWPAGRRRAEPRRYEVFDLGPPPPGELAVAPTVGIRFDTTSWFPALEGREQIRGAYLVSMAMFDESGTATAFRGTSTLLVTSSRLLGVCPKGESAAGPLDPAAGRVAAWSVVLDQVDWVQAEGSAEGGHLTLKGWDAHRPWALITKPRVAVEGAFRPALLTDLADVVNRAKHSSA